MAQFSLVITYPDAQQTRILNAMKKHWTTQVIDAEGVATTVVPTTAQAIEKLRGVVIANVKDIVFMVEREAAVKAAEAGVVVVDAT